MKMKWFSVFFGLLMAAGTAQAWYGGPGAPGYGYGPYAAPSGRRASGCRPGAIPTATW